MPAPDENPDSARLRRLSGLHVGGTAAARRGLAARRAELARLVGALQEALDSIMLPYQRYRIRRWLELTILSLLAVGETVVAVNVVQALGLTATATDLIAVTVGAAATGLAWMIGHEWAVAHDPQAVVAGRRGWLLFGMTTAGAFLAANLAVRVYYGVLAEQADHLGNGLTAPLMSGSLLTAVTAALMTLAAFITAHAETGKEAELRAQLHRARRELRSLEARIGVGQPGPDAGGHLAVVEE
jgi:multidrug efflux pump subunit AcrA (membrane-fusion protein)